MSGSIIHSFYQHARLLSEGYIECLCVINFIPAHLLGIKSKKHVLLTPTLCQIFAGHFVVVVSKIVLDFQFFNIPQNHLFLSNKRDQPFCESET